MEQLVEKKSVNARAVCCLIMAQDTGRSVWFTKETGLLALPGGKIEPGESMRRAVLREVREETGLRIKRPVFLGIATARRWSCAAYSVVLTREFPLIESHEGPVAWRRVPERDALAFPGYMDWLFWRLSMEKDSVMLRGAESIASVR